VAGVACLVAISAAALPRRVQQLAILAILVVYAGILTQKARVANVFRRGVFAGVKAVNTVSDDARPVLSLERATLYPTALSAANRNPHLAYLIVPTNRIDRYFRGRPDSATERNAAIVERDAAVAHNKVFGFPRLVQLKAMQRTSSFFFLLPPHLRPPPFSEVFDGFDACRVNPRLLLFVAREGRRHTPRTINNTPVCDPSVVQTASARTAGAPAVQSR
jgi:hypothetical protein